MLLRRLLAGGVILLFAVQAAALFNPFAVMSNQTASEKTLTGLAAEIRELGRAAERSDRLDAKAERLWEEGRRVWAKSPANSANAISMRTKSGYEAGMLVQAMADYYALTGRSGRAIPILADAIEESRKLRYYAEWRELTLQLVRRYQHLGMVDHADARLEELLRFMGRFGFSLDRLPGEMNMDAVVFARLHALRMEVNPDRYRDAKTVLELMRFYERTVREAPQAWGWDPMTGFRYAEYAAPFLFWAASHGDAELLGSAQETYRGIRQRNVETNPFVLASELGSAAYFAMSRLGLDIYVNVGFRGLYTSTELDGTVGELPGRLRRYAERAEFDAALDLAQAELLAGHAEAALVEVEHARDAVPAIDGFYRGLDPEYRLLDRFPLDLMRLAKLEAKALEDLGRWQEALDRFEQYIAWSEKERASLPLEERQHFFRGQAREAYLGAIRARAEIYRAGSNDTNMTGLLQGMERLKARQFQEALGVDHGQVALTLAGLRERLGEGDGILLIQDAETELLTILISREGVSLSHTEKTPGWDDWIFELRNRLAEDVEYDEKGFARLGSELFEPVADEISPLRHLFVVTDGVLSALPLSIIPYRPDHLLDDARYLTLIPSLGSWMAGSTLPAQTGEKALFVVADPIFEEQKREQQIGTTLLATRGSSALGYFQRLPETLDEGRSIMNSFHAAGKMLSGERAVESSVKSEPLARYSHLHFATHGIISNDLPGFTEPALVLGYEEGEDGFLFASEVAKLNLHAELTVLSACNTGNGKYFNGEGLMGMGRAFMLAGSKSVIVSLWPVESRSTQMLMEYLYEFMGLGMNADVALWNAQRRLRGLEVGTAAGRRGVRVETTEARVPAADVSRDGDASTYSSPYFWSPFLLISAG